MHSHSWRLLTAGHLHLDSNLRGLAVAKEDHHDLIRDATLAAFETMIESALEHSIDLLLLTGSVSSDTPSLRACTIFRDGMETLLEEGISVVWAADNWEQVDYLKNRGCLPAELSVLQTGSGKHRIELSSRESVGDKFGTICCELISSNNRSSQKFSAGNSDPSLLQIGILDHAIGQLPLEKLASSTNYDAYQLILSGDAETRHTTRHQNTIFHAPGALQALSSQTTGTCCASLVEVDSRGEIEIRRIRTAAVQHEQLEVIIQQEETLEQLLYRAEQRLDELLLEVDFGPAKLLQVSWEFRGPHSSFLQVSSQELQEYISALQPQVPLQIMHEVIIAAQLTGVESSACDLQEEGLREQFLRLLGEQNSSQASWDWKQIQKKLGNNTLPLDKLLAEVPQKELCHRAAEFGLLALQEKLLEAG